MDKTGFAQETSKKNRSLQTDSCSVLTLHKKELRDDFGNNTSTNSTATFMDREAQTFFHGYRVDQSSDEVDVVTRHYHFNAFVQFYSTSYVSGTEVELWTVAFKEWSVTTAFFFRQDVHFSFGGGVRLNGAWLDQTLATLYVFTLGTTQQGAEAKKGHPLI